MDLKSLLPKKDHKEKSELFWSIVIEPKWVQVAIWRVVDEKVEVVGKSNPSPWSLDEELISATDAALTSAIQELSDDEKEPEKTVFSVVSSWVEGGQIKGEYLEKIKKLCTELSLKPAGFVVLSEAIANFVKVEEGAPLSSVVLGVSKDALEVSLFKLGNLLGTTEVARSISAVEDVVEGLSRFAQVESLPSRFIIYNSKENELEEVKQSLIQANWEDFENLKFLHTPKIEIIPVEKKMDAVCLAGAHDIANVSEILKVEESEAELVINDGDNNVEEISPEELGFAIGEDVTGSKNVETPSVSDELPDIEVPKEKRKISIKMPAIFAKLKEKLKRKPSPDLDAQKAFSTGRKAWVWGVVFIVLLLIAGIGVWWFYPKATVTIYLTTSKLDERVKITIDPDASSPDLASGVLPGKVLTTSINGDKTSQTSGTKTVGDKATGEVTLYRVGSEISLDSGTKITGPGSLAFTLDKDVKVASGSASSPGTTKVTVTAASIGADYNLAAGSAFGVSNYSLSDIEAKNEESFSGGSSREINAVSEDDQEKLEESLKDELKENALKELAGQLGSGGSCSGCILIKESYSSEIESKEFSSKVGDEATTLKLSMEESVKVLAISKTDLVAFSQELLKDRVPDGFVLRGDQIDVNFEFDEEVDDTYILTALIKVNLLPEVDPDTIASKIVGKYPVLVESFLINEIPGFARAEVRLQPKLPGRLGTLPHVEKNIEVEIAAER